MLANSEVKPFHLPAPREVFEGFDPKNHAPITELHTHSSAQLSAPDLIQLALDHSLDYPVELLTRKLGIKLSAEEEAAIKVGGGIGLRFSPGEKEGLACEKQGASCDVIPLAALTKEHLLQLQHQLRVPQDMTLCFSDFDRAYYRFVNPIVKNPTVTKEMILKIARDFASKGVRYAELSTASMLNLDKNGASWFREAVAAIKQAEEETGVQLRFLISIPRSYTSSQAMAEAEKIKYAARHPYVVGMDLVGYEYNPTSDFTAILSHMADWARTPEGTELRSENGWDFQKDFTFRIHAGETGKNEGNVAEAVRIAEQSGVQVRVAHAIHEAPDTILDNRIRKLSSLNPPLVSMEFCAPSNIAYNNIKTFLTLPFKRWLGCCKTWFLGSDGAGAIQTDPTQLALSALASGVTLSQLGQMRANEEAFIARQKTCFDRKSAAFKTLYAPDPAADTPWNEANKHFFDKLSKHIEWVKDITNPETLDPINPHLPPGFDGKMPVLVAGAAKESFAELSPRTREEIKRTMRMLVEALDPQKTYFVMGRTKREGITAVLDEAILDYNKRHPKNKFKVLALITQDTPDLPRSIDWVVAQRGEIGQVPENISNFMHAQYDKLKLGLNIFIGGSNFTSDMIKKSRDAGEMPFLMMESAAGASQEASKEVRPERRFSNGASLLSRIHQLSLPIEGGVFREGFNPEHQDHVKELIDACKSPTSKAGEKWPLDRNASRPVSRRS